MSASIKQALGIAMVLLSLGAFESTAAALDEQERAELELFRELTPDLQRQLKEAQAQLQHSAGEPKQVRSAREDYWIAYYKSEAALYAAKSKVFEWQLFAANTILALVSILSLSGIGFAGYQLWQSTKNPKAVDAPIEFEVSLQKFRLQSGIVGLAVLAFSGLFLVLFLKEVYTVRLIPFVAPAAGQQAGNTTPAVEKDK